MKIPTIFIFIISINTFAQIGFKGHSVVDETDAIRSADFVHSIDMDNDGDLDVIVHTSSQLGWYENIDGQGSFGKIKIIYDRSVSSVYPTDIDNDGDLDLLIRSQSWLIWLEKIDNDAGIFGSPNIILTDVAGATIYPSDINNDGNIDIIVDRSSETIVWYENVDGLGSFGASQSIGIGRSSDIRTSDIDGDGDMDIITVSFVDKELVWFENIDGLGTFGTKRVITSNAGFALLLEVTDIDGDDDLDILSVSSNNNTIAWYENLDGIGTFSTERIITTDILEVQSLHASDIDQDGDIDILSGSLDNKTVWYENINGQGAFDDPKIIVQYSEFRNVGVKSIHTGDLDGDGDIDVLSSYGIDQEVNWSENIDMQGGSWNNNVISGKESDSLNYVYSIDLDMDGDMDIISVSLFQIAFYENLDGNGNFGSRKIIKSDNDSKRSVYITDLDNDSDLDILCASYANIYWYENTNGLGDFNDLQIISSDLESIVSVYAADIDGDEDMDVLSASRSDDKISWYENTSGQGDFGTQQIITTEADYALSVYSADIDNDGDMDVISSSGFDDKIAWYENTNGQGNFGAQQIISIEADYPQSIYSIDIDSDGDMDIISASNGDNKIAWYENTDGLGNFGIQQIITTNTVGTKSVHWGDIDNDGDLDIFSSSKTDNKVAWYENTDGKGQFGSEQIITESADSVFFVYVDNMNSDNDIDVLVASKIPEDFNGDDQIVWYENLNLVTNEINGNIRIDIDANGCTSDDLPISNIMITTNDGINSFSTFTLNNGFYQLFPNEGDFTTIVAENLTTYFNITPNSQTSSFVGINNVDTDDFCIEPNRIVNDLSISLYPISEVRPGFSSTYQLVYKNIGTTKLDGRIVLEYDSAKLNFINASETNTSSTIGTLAFDFRDLNLYETRTVDLKFTVFPPPTVNINDILSFKATINPIANDVEENNNIFEFNQTVIGSFDPNDITVLEGKEVLIENSNKYLHYVIRFQNTGTADAINVRVENVLDNNLDWNTLQLESLSHSGTVEIRDGKNVSFIFDNINLPDSNTDESNSHGYITYKIKPKNSIAVGDNILSTASIFFDFNTPVITNTVNTKITEIVDVLSVPEFKNHNISIFPVPSNNKIFLLNRGNLIIDEIEIYSVKGSMLLKQKQNFHSIDVSNLTEGIYFLRIKHGSGYFTNKIIKN